MRRRPTAIAPWAFAFFAACACDDHEPEVERRGPPNSDADVNVPPPNCGDGGVPSVAIEFCQAELVMRTVCQKCHSDPPMHGAPMSLVTFEDTQAVWDESTGKLVWQRMQDMVVADLMPLQGVTGVEVEPLTCEEKSTLLGWLDQCARPEGGTDCGNPSTLTACDPRWIRDGGT